MELEVDIQNFFSSDAETLKNALLARDFENGYPLIGVPEEKRKKIIILRNVNSVMFGSYYILGMGYGYSFSKLRGKSAFLSVSASSKKL